MKRIEVGISTRDRWENLRTTLRRSCGFLPAGSVIRVAIDGGRAPENIKTEFAAHSIVWHEYPEREGYIRRRNQLAALCEADYYLSLDDDSYPISGDIFKAVDYLDSHPLVGVLGFQIQRLDASFQVPSLSVDPYQTRSFVGCAHLLRVGLFNKLGGYDETLIHQGEEGHYGALIYRHGFTCMHYPGVNFVHEATVVARSHARIGYHAARNKMLWAYDYAPGTGAVALKMFRGAAEQTALALRERSGARVRGWVAGAWLCLCKRRHRLAFSPRQYREFLRLAYY